MPELLKSVLFEFPIFIVTLFLLVAAFTQARSEKGGILIILGAASLVLHRIFQFVHFNFLYRRLFHNIYDKMGEDFAVLVLELMRAGIQLFLFTGLLLIAIGIFLRPSNPTGAS